MSKNITIIPPSEGRPAILLPQIGPYSFKPVAPQRVPACIFFLQKE